MGCPSSIKHTSFGPTTSSTCLTATPTQVSANQPACLLVKTDCIYFFASVVITPFEPDEARREGAAEPMMDWRRCSGVGVRGSGSALGTPVHDTPKLLRTVSPAWSKCQSSVETLPGVGRIWRPRAFWVPPMVQLSKTVPFCPSPTVLLVYLDLFPD